ncbi:hypothetical protein [Streptomyces sp. TP-A0874]|uniref:hypothetical protein n=1 Tax=Streptomyces sp. TP-A0874 TaxID=549819 RepID=UPI001112E4C7|nr:hypothetical protein [Streptomyces sp. TP-A0874]
MARCDIRWPDALRWTVMPTAAVLCWWTTLRWAVEPAAVATWEAALAAGGWGLGLIPVHCAPRPGGESRTGPRSPERTG